MGVVEGAFWLSVVLGGSWVATYVLFGCGVGFFGCSLFIRLCVFFTYMCGLTGMHLRVVASFGLLFAGTAGSGL